MSRDVVRTVCPRDCYDSCGIAVHRRDGSVFKVMGDPEHAVARGALCGKCAVAYNGVWRDPAARLAHPLRRIGKKGEGRFARVSWEEALDEIARRLGALEPKTILNAHYTGTRSLLAGAFPMRFFNRLGATEIEPDTVCNFAGIVALERVYGSAVHGFDPRSAKDAKAILLWGVNPSASAPHADKHWLGESGATILVVDPVRTATAARAALHLRPRPGTDAALAFGMLHVLRRDGLIDRAFVDRHVDGWTEVEAMLGATTPAWAEAATGVPAADLERAARLYADGPTLLWIGQGLQRQTRGGQIVAAVAALPAATGQLAKPGAGFLYLNGAGQSGLDRGAFVAKVPKRADAPASISHMDLAASLADPARAKAFFCWNANPAASNPDPIALRRALAREDLFTVVVELFQTDTADWADILLPAANFLEFDDVVTSYMHLNLSAQQKAAEPPGEALPNQEIFRRLAKRMGFDEPALHESDGVMLDRALAATGLVRDFADLAAKGTVSPPPRVQFAERRFATPSGKIDLRGLDRTADAPSAPGKLRLLSPASPWALNTSYANDPKLEAKLGDAAAVHPSEARARGHAPGARVIVANATARLPATLVIDEAVPPGVLVLPKGCWPKRAPSGLNVNALNPSLRADLGASTALHSVEVELLGA
jgi:anaerobic selenocysteine-containing dehydrogenase